jgi:hypothetical protein
MRFADLAVVAVRGHSEKSVLGAHLGDRELGDIGVGEDLSIDSHAVDDESGFDLVVSDVEARARHGAAQHAAEDAVDLDESGV